MFNAATHDRKVGKMTIFAENFITCANFGGSCHFTEKGVLEVTDETERDQHQNASGAVILMSFEVAEKGRSEVIISLFGLQAILLWF